MSPFSDRKACHPFFSQLFEVFVIFEGGFFLLVLFEDLTVLFLLQAHFPNEIFQTIIPRNVRLSEAPSFGQTILSYAPASAGAMAYGALAAEFMQRMEEQKP